MAAEGSDDAGNLTPNGGQEGGRVALQVSARPAWYTFLNEDWLATLFGLLLVILLVAGLLHTIP
ncbi:MAG TPA: hypothetical protein VKX46_03765 [Ktedonobacteraceae bacterium]|nr:hypothetical protein [Ktedonobacteraceae bacterium]